MNWDQALRVTFQVDADTSIKGVLCAGRDDHSGYSLEYFSFKTDAGFQQVYPVAGSTEKNGLVDRATTVFSNEDVAQVSTLGSYAIRSGPLLTIQLEDIEFDAKSGHTEYRLKLRFPQEMGRTFIRTQPQAFHEMSLSVFRAHERVRVWSQLPESGDREANSLTIEIDSTALAINRLVLVSSDTEFILESTDFPLKQGAAGRPNSSKLNNTLRTLTEAEKGYVGRQRELENKLIRESSQTYSRFAPTLVP